MLPDCKVDCNDLASIGENWLESSYEIAAVAPDDDNHLTVHYEFDDGSGTTASDSSGNGYDAFVDFWDGSWDSSGKYGGCIDFDWTWVRGNADSLNTVTDEVTFSMWANIDVSALDGSRNNSNTVIHVGKADSSNDFVKAQVGRQWLSVDPEAARVATFICGDSERLTTTGEFLPVTDPNLSGWHHYAFTKNSADETQKIYVDGELMGSNTDASRPISELASAAQYLNIGCIFYDASGTSKYFDGKIDDVRVYDYELSQAEIVYLADKASITVPLPSAIEAIDDSLNDNDAIDFRDFSTLADNWLDEVLWP